MTNINGGEFSKNFDFLTCPTIIIIVSVKKIHSAEKKYISNNANNCYTCQISGLYTYIRGTRFLLEISLKYKSRTKIRVIYTAPMLWRIIWISNGRFRVLLLIKSFKINEKNVFRSGSKTVFNEIPFIMYNINEYNELYLFISFYLIRPTMVFW